MKLVEERLRTCVETALGKGYTVDNLRVHYTNKCSRVTIRMKITPFPKYDDRRPWGGYRNTVYGSTETIETFIQELPTL